MLFLQLDEDLNKNYARTYSNSNHDQANDFCFSNWGGYVIAGSTQVNLDSDFWLFYIDEN